MIIYGKFHITENIFFIVLMVHYIPVILFLHGWGKGRVPTQERIYL